MRTLFLTLGLVLLFAMEFLRVYFIMPFPGSQHSNTIQFAYWLGRNIVWLRVFALLLTLYPLWYYLQRGKVWKKILLTGIFMIYVVVFYLFNFRFQADKMFYQPTNKNFASAGTGKISEDKLVIGVAINGEAKAYPIQLIGYHHQVRDTVGHVPIMVTYCTVCRTGRVFRPEVNGKSENFRLVGMDHFNAMFEDASTKSWWQQATGVAVAGPLSGTALAELPSKQSTLAAWLRQYPNSLILQPDTLFNKQYEDLADYDKGTVKSSLEKRDSSSWKFKSWIVGVSQNQASKAYDWNELVDKKIIQDSLPGLPITIWLGKDTSTFYVWNRNVKGTTLQFLKDNQPDIFKDLNTHSTWNIDGLCIEGALKGEHLQPVQASQEFWHSWQTFHPRTQWQ